MKTQTRYAARCPESGEKVGFTLDPVQIDKNQKILWVATTTLVANFERKVAKAIIEIRL